MKNTQKTDWGRSLLSVIGVAICAVFAHEIIPVVLAGTIVLPDVPGVAKIGAEAQNDTFYMFVLWQLLPIAKVILEGVAVAYIIYYGAHMALSQGNDEAVKKDRTALTYAIYGFIVLNAGDMFVRVFDPIENVGGDPNQQGFTNIIAVIIKGLRYIAGVVAVTWLVLSGFRMVTAAGKEEVITKNRTQILWSILGLILIALAGTMEDIIFNAKTSEGISLFTSLTNMMLLFTVPIAFLFLIIGGIYMITAHGNDAMLNKGKKMVTATVIALVIIYSAYTILTEVLKFSNW